MACLYCHLGALMIEMSVWSKIWNIGNEYRSLKRRGRKVKRGRPYKFRKYGPVIHIHDKTAKQIVHFYCGDYSEASLIQLQRELAEIRIAYIGRKHITSIRLVLINDGSYTLPSWFIPTTTAMLPEVV